MIYRDFQGLKLSGLGFGAMRLPVLADGSVNEHLTTEMVRYAMEHGVNYFDTAYPYHGGMSEVVLGRDYGWHGIWMAVFHSISAFCNAGFDILGTNNNLYPSLTGYVQNPVINITIMLLIITGGIGFLTWDDICENKLHFHRYRMQSKVILVTTLTLIVLPALFFFFVDFDALPLGERVQAALFQSVTPRTAGFNTVDLPAMSGASLGVMILLMLIGGSPGSTAGGMKTTTLAVLLANAADKNCFIIGDRFCFRISFFILRSKRRENLAKNRNNILYNCF